MDNASLVKYVMEISAETIAIIPVPAVKKGFCTNPIFSYPLEMENAI